MSALISAMYRLAWARWLQIIDRKIPTFPIAKNQTPALESVPRRSAAMAQAGPYVVVEVEARACPLRQLQNPRGGVGAAVSTARVAYDASSSEAVTAVTDYSSSSPLFFGQPAKCEAVHTSPPIRP